MSSAPEIPVRLGDVLAGKYRVERVLGHGGMGVVIAATQLDLGRLVALKFLLRAFSQGDIVARFLREARIVGGLRSEHVTRVYELGQLENGVHYMAMEYLEGADLAALLAQHGRFHFSEAAAIVRQACEAVAEAHQSGVVHRDLKPANLFCTQRPNGAQLIKVLDFGISKSSTASTAEHSMTRTSAIMGSPYYMSPEQMTRPKTVDFRTDIWSLGVILHELVTGKVPFQGETLPELTLNVHHEEPPPIANFNPEAPAAYQAIVTRCLQKDRELRYGSIRELSEALAACEGTGNWGGSIARARRPGRLVAFIVSAVGVVALGTTATLFLLRSRSDSKVEFEDPNRVNGAPASVSVVAPSRVPAIRSGALDSRTREASTADSNPASSPAALASGASSAPSPVLPVASAHRLRGLPSTRSQRAADTRPPESALAKPSRRDGAPSNRHPAGWDDEILKP